MKKKKSFNKRIRVMGIIFFIAPIIIIVSINFFIDQKAFINRTNQMRIDYINQKKQTIKQEVNHVVEMINEEKAQSEQLTKKTLKDRVYEAHAIVNHIYNQNKHNKNKNEIQKMIMDALRPIRFSDKTGSYFIAHISGETILSPAIPAFEGKNIINLQDSRGNYNVKKEMALLKSKGEGFVTGYWPKPDLDPQKNYKKITFVKLFKPYNWSIGAGLYAIDIEKQLQKKLLDRIAKIRFGKEGYIFVNKLNGDALVSNGIHLTRPDKLWIVFNKYPEKMKELFAKEHEAALKAEGDYIYYSFPKMSNTKQESPKSSFIYGIPDWQWIIGAGVYLDDIETEITILQTNLNTENITKIILIFFVVIIITILFLSQFNRLTKNIKKDFELFISFFNRAAFSDKEIDLQKIKFRELEFMANTANKMLYDKRIAKQQLQNEKEQLFVTIKSIGDGVITTDTTGHIIIMNTVAEELTGWKNREVEGTLLTEVFKINKDNNRIKEEDNPIIDVLKSGKRVELSNQISLISKDGSQYQITASAAPIKDDKNKMIGIVLVFRDVTKEYKMKNELNQSEKKFKEMTNLLPQVIYEIDNSGNLTFINEQAFNTFGFPKKEYHKGFNILQAIIPEDRDRIKQNIQKILAGDKIENPEYTALRNDGSTFPIIIYSNPILKKGVSIGLRGVIIDISERKEAEKEKIKLQNQLIQSRKMDAIGQLAGGIAHDFNNMLAGIMGAAQLLKSPQRNIDEESIKFVDMIMQASERAADLTAKLLAFGRKGKISNTAINLNKVISDTVEILSKTVNKKIQISFKGNAVNNIIEGDRSALQSVLMNMGINAAHAMPEGGSLSFETTNIKLNETYSKISPFEIKAGDYIEIEIRDTGTGISKKDIQKIFDPFFTTKEQGKGTGLGLSAVYGTIQDHHGAINVYSEEGEGTVFHILLPCSNTTVKQDSIKENPIKGSGLILLVDDEEIIRTTGEYLLTELGYKVLLAKNGIQAVEIFREQHKKINLVIMDMIMPEMNGREAFLKLKKIDNECRVIISSGFTKDENLNDLKEKGLAGFIRKPFRDTELSRLLIDTLK